MTGGQPPRPPGEFCQYVILLFYDSVRTCARERHFELLDGTVQILGRSWRPLWEPEGPRVSLPGLRAYQWDCLYPRFGGVQNGTTGPISEDFQRPFHSQISYKRGLPYRLTCQPMEGKSDG